MMALDIESLIRFEVISDERVVGEDEALRILEEADKESDIVEFMDLLFDVPFELGDGGDCWMSEKVRLTTTEMRRLSSSLTMTLMRKLPSSFLFIIFYKTSHRNSTEPL